MDAESTMLVGKLCECIEEMASGGISAISEHFESFFGAVNNKTPDIQKGTRTFFIQIDVQCDGASVEAGAQLLEPWRVDVLEKDNERLRASLPEAVPDPRFPH